LLPHHYRKELVKYIWTLIGPIVKTENIRSGKIMRRILRKVAANEISDLGDTTTLADPALVDDIVKNRVL
jgi:acetyl-CoA synthetase